MKNSKLLGTFCLLILAFSGFAQISTGHIVYERKTNLYKKYKEYPFAQDLPADQRIKIDMFDLYFNDTASYFGPQESDVKEIMSGATSKSKVYQNFSTGKLYSVKSIWGTESHVTDSLRIRIWKLVPGKRKICGYDCQKARWDVNDSTKVYAYFSNDLSTSVGPESFNGLPGTILGLATEDGGVVYFAKEVLLERVDPVILNPKKYKGKIYQNDELKEKLTKEYGDQSWSKSAINELFGIW